MKKGVIYFNLGSKCLPRLVTSIHSLRKYYDGPVTIISTGHESNEVCQNISKITELNVKNVNADFGYVPSGKNSVFLMKASVNKHTPYDISVFLDSDTIVRGSIDELFEMAEKYDFVVPQFSTWTTNTKAIKRRINSWSNVYPDLMDAAHNFGPAINCGVFAFKKDTHFVNEWMDKILPGRQVFIPDETGMQVILHKYKHYVAPQIFNCSCKYSNPRDPNVRIIHFHGRKHCRLNSKKELIYNSDLWVKEYEECESKNLYERVGLQLPANDRQLKNYMKRGLVPAVPKDKSMTIVTAVNPPYLEKLHYTLPTWSLKPQFNNCPVIIFHNGFKRPKRSLKWVHKVLKGHNVKLIHWDMDEYDGNRELMLSSFVFGAAAYVETPYFVKIDADAFFTNSQDLFLPNHFKYDIAGHKWRYTKPGKWLVELDEWAESKDIDGEVYLSEPKVNEAKNSKRYGHGRIASWVCLHKTDFVIEAAMHAGSRLPIPSHDTYLWYMAQRLPDREWCWHNFKKMGASNSTKIEIIKERVINEAKISIA